MPLFRPDIGRLERKRDVDGLTKALRHKRPDIRREAAGALGHVGDGRAADSLVEALDDWIPEVRIGAAAALGRLGGAAYDRAVDRLVVQLGNDIADTRQVAVRALGSAGGRRAVPPILAALGDRDVAVREAALESLRRLAEPALEHLLTRLDDADWRTRNHAASHLGRLADTRAVEPLVRALDDKHPAVRLTAAISLAALGVKGEALRAQGAGRAVALLIRRLRKHLDESVIWALGELGDPRAVEPLVAALRGADEGRDRAMTEFLAWAGDSWAPGDIGPHAGSYATRASGISERYSKVRKALEEALERIGGPEAERALAEYRAEQR